MLNHFRCHLGLYGIYTVLLLIGLMTTSDYGVSWDENAMHEIGQTSYEYVFHDDNRLKTYVCRNYGVGVELPLIIVEKALGLKTDAGIYTMRHMVSHLLFLTLSISVYFLCYNLFKDRGIALIAYLFFILHPRLYAHSFFNSKDIPFMVMYAVCFWQFQRTFSRMTNHHFIFLGIVTGYLIDIRIMGILFFVCCLGFCLVQHFLQKEEVKKTFTRISLFTASSVLTVYLGWPYLWSGNPVSNFLIAFKEMSQFGWPSAVLFMGNLVPAPHVPPYYIPAWISLTTPILILFLGVQGSILLLARFLRSPIQALKDERDKNALVWLATFSGAICAVIILKSVLYDGWRQMYFVYPAFVLLAAYGVSRIAEIKRYPNGKIIVYLAVFLQLIEVGTFLITSHPFQQVYFNRLISRAPEYIRKNYEYDYWGASFKNALEYILQHDHRDSIPVAVSSIPGVYNYRMLPPEQQKRIHLVLGDSIDTQSGYFITNHRFHPQEYLWLTPIAKNIHNLVIQNNSVVSIWQYSGAQNAVQGANRFEIRKDGVVLDTKTHLMWAAQDNGSDINWEGAGSYCKNLNLAGYHDWRMPTEDELRELYNAGLKTGDATHKYVITITGQWLWAGTPESSSDTAPSFVMNSGFNRTDYKTISFYHRILPVRDMEP